MEALGSLPKGTRFLPSMPCGHNGYLLECDLPKCALELRFFYFIGFVMYGAICLHSSVYFF